MLNGLEYVDIVCLWGLYGWLEMQDTQNNLIINIMLSTIFT
jgi:hypothetical protein